MTDVITFSISGLAIVLFITAKNIEIRREEPLLIFKLISKGDIYIRDIYHKIVHWYSEGKEYISFFCKRQIPIHFKNSFNKLMVFLKEKRDQYADNMRDSKLLKKSDGISEFFKNMSDIEKGNGEINDVYKDSFQEEKKGLE